MFRLCNVSKKFSQGSESLYVLDEASYEFEAGISYAIMGPSGSGKSTLLHMLMGIEKLSSGSLYLGDSDITKLSQADLEHVRSSIGIMFQQSYLLSELTVLENIMLYAILHNKITENDRNRAHQLLEEVDLGDKHDMLPFLLSGGEKQRVALLRALFHKPCYLLVDEPTGSLDESSGREVVRLLQQYQSRYNMGIVMSTHDKEVAQSMNEIVCIKDKKLETI